MLFRSHRSLLCIRWPPYAHIPRQNQLRVVDIRYVDKSGRLLWTLAFILLFSLVFGIHQPHREWTPRLQLACLSERPRSSPGAPSASATTRSRNSPSTPCLASGLLGGFDPHRLVLIAQFYIAISPISGTPSNQSGIATVFFQ